MHQGARQARRVIASISRVARHADRHTARIRALAMSSADTGPLRSSATPPLDDDAAQHDWTIALAGGEGARLTEYVERRFGRRIPKQYCCLLGNRSMLEHTLE